jgi:hypothetical protein
MAGRAVGADPLRDPGGQVVVELGTLAQDHEEGHPAFGAGSRHVHNEGVGDLVKCQDGAVDLAGAHTDAAAVDRRVRAAVDHGSSPGGDLDPVSVAPDTGIHVEVGGAVALAFRVVPEEDGHRGHRLGDYELADLVGQRPAVLREGLDLGAQRAGLKLAAVDGQDRDAADEGGADVGPAGSGEQPGIGADVVVDPLKPLGGERGAGGADGAQLRQVAASGGLRAGLHAPRDVAGGGAEARDPGALCEIPEDVHVGMPRVPVVEHDRGGGEQSGDEEVPHHPPRGGEPEDAVALAGIDVKVQLLQVLEQDPAVALDDRLGKAGGARGIEDPEGVVERHRLEFGIGSGTGAFDLRPRDAVREARGVGVRVEVRHEDGVLQRGHLALESRDHVHTVEVLAAVAVAVGGEQDLGLDLGEAVHHRPGAEVG